MVQFSVVHWAMDSSFTATDKEAWRLRLAEPGQLAWGVALRKAAQTKGFWKQTWQGLVELTLEADDLFAFTQLILLKRTDEEPLPPLPPLTLEKLHAFIMRQPHSVEWGSLLLNALPSHVTRSEQQLSFDTWASVAVNGGWNTWNLTPLEEALPECEWYRNGRARWLTSPDAREAAITALQKPSPPWVDWGGMFQQHWDAWPAEHRKELVHRLSKFWCDQFWCGQMSRNSSFWKPVREAYISLHATGMDLTETAWASWWEARLNEHAIGENALDQLHRLRVAFSLDSSRPPPGMTWGCERAHAWGEALGRSLCPTLEATQLGIHPQHELALSLLMDLDGWLTAWGLQTVETAQAFEAGVGTTNPHWEALLQEGTHNLHATPDFAQKRSAWRALRLERTTRAQSVAPRLAGKVRM